MLDDLLLALTESSTDAEREAVVMDMSLAVLQPELREALEAVAVPHWFDAGFLDALLGEESDLLYEQILALSFVELVPGRGYAIHERTRKQLLHNLWREDPERFRQLSAVAAGYCAEQVSKTEAIEWQAEEIYHRLVSDPDAGMDGLRALATKWANYEYHTYEEIEYIVRLAGEQIDAGRLSGAGEAWTRLWQARLVLIFGRPDLAPEILDQITLQPAGDPILAAEVAQTRGDMLAQLGDEAGMELAWQKAYDRYSQMADGSGQLDAFLVAEKMRAAGLADPQIAAHREEVPAPPGADALRLIDNIEYAWIDGVLRTAVDESIKLRMARDGRVASHIVLHHPQGIDRPVGAGRLSRLFCAAGQSMLILGAPGSGKTITLLQLLEELLDEARADGEAPMPLLFNLSSFGKFAQEKEPDLTVWVADQAYKQYRLKRETTREQLAVGTEITLLMDGLDEVPLAERETCVDAINEFIQTYPCGLVVCSRIADYQALNRKLTLAHALVLQPLSDGQIAAVIEMQEEPARSAMLAQIKNDWQLREALRSPLLISLYPQAFPALDTSEWLSTDTVEARRQSLFAAYVDTVFQQPTTTKSSDEEIESFKAQSRGWLTFLAGKMQKAGTTIFYVEDLQPDWLPQQLIGRYRVLYGLIFGSFMGTLVGLTSVLIVGSATGLVSGLSNGLRGGLIIFIAITAAIWVTRGIKLQWIRVVIGVVIPWLILALSVGLTIGQDDGLRGILFFGLMFAPVFGLGIFVSGGISSFGLEIRLREQVKILRPSSQQIKISAKRGGLFGTILGLIGGLMLGTILGLWGTLDDELVYQMVCGLFGVIFGVLCGGLTLGLLGGGLGLIFGVLLAFLSTPPIDKRPYPGQGVRASLLNSLLIAAAVMICVGVSTWFFLWNYSDELSVASLVLALVLVNIIPLAFTWFGGLAWCQHIALRILLSRNNWLPPVRQLIPWLDKMTELGLLRRVGGGYIFIHRSLLEYFAALPL